jgi:hypothetical protein
MIFTRPWNNLLFIPSGLQLWLISGFGIVEHLQIFRQASFIWARSDGVHVQQGFDRQDFQPEAEPTLHPIILNKGLRSGEVFRRPDLDGTIFLLPSRCEAEHADSLALHDNRTRSTASRSQNLLSWSTPTLSQDIEQVQ